MKVELKRPKSFDDPADYLWYIGDVCVDLGIVEAKIELPEDQFDWLDKNRPDPNDPNVVESASDIPIDKDTILLRRGNVSVKIVKN